MLSFSCQRKEAARTFYFDSVSGNDMNNGFSPSTAFKSFKKIKEITFRPSDSILLKRGVLFKEILDVSASGTYDFPIVISSYGKGEKPRVVAPDSSLYAVRIYNSRYLTVSDIDISNYGSTVLPRRTGVLLHIENFGKSPHVRLQGLDIHDVNGSLIKNDGGGSGILIVNEGDSVVSVFEHLLIENCTIRRCQRNAMIWSGYWQRDNWHPSLHTIVRNNLIEDVPGDGIVPIGCDSTLIEYNIMRNSPKILPKSEAAAGIWPWSCDNTLIQFNEVGGHKAPWDGQGFDSDWNCRNTVIQYNYSHDNEGGFLLICNSGVADTIHNIGNLGTIVRYNLSINDAIRASKTRAGYFSPTIHLAGPVKNTIFMYNLFYINKKENNMTDRSLITLDSWGGYPDSTLFASNVFFVEEQSRINYTQSTRNYFEKNFFIGKITGLPKGEENKAVLPTNQFFSNDAEIVKDIRLFLENNSDSKGYFVNKEKIESFFHDINQ